LAYSVLRRDAALRDGATLMGHRAGKGRGSIAMDRMDLVRTEELCDVGGVG